MGCLKNMINKNVHPIFREILKSINPPMSNKEKNIKKIKNNLQEARRKGWWIACFYWEKQLEKLDKGIDWSKDNVYDAIGRPDLKPTNQT